MSQFSHIIFDLDGTLTDNTAGITKAVKYSLKKMNIEMYSDEILKRFVGPPLQWSFKSIFGMNENETSRAVDFFREYYGEKGWYENQPYTGVSKMLESLHGKGVKLYLATAKLEKFAGKILSHFRFDKYIIGYIGADYHGNKAEKKLMIAELLKKENIVPSEKVAMVGDTAFDIKGGRSNGLSTVAVGYGFGTISELKQSKPDFFAANVNELSIILHS
jgi:phosphoglycolate phosphatase